MILTNVSNVVDIAVQSGKHNWFSCQAYLSLRLMTPAQLQPHCLLLDLPGEMNIDQSIQQLMDGTGTN